MIGYEKELFRISNEAFINFEVSGFFLNEEVLQEALFA